MNTADRGLKTMDYALRRRFSFYDIKPIFGSEKFRVRMQMHNNMHLIKVLRQIKLLNKEISEDIENRAEKWEQILKGCLID